LTFKSKLGSTVAARYGLEFVDVARLCDRLLVVYFVAKEDEVTMTAIVNSGIYIDFPFLSTIFSEGRT
jgi:hypothetical protein